MRFKKLVYNAIVSLSLFLTSAVVEVADFNFGDDVGSDMEYKSFRRRLVESVHDAVNEMRQNRSGVPTDLTGDSSVGYGSMK